jgi:hypothetical protein
MCAAIPYSLNCACVVGGLPTCCNRWPELLAVAGGKALSPQKFRQLRDIGSDTPRFVSGYEVGLLAASAHEQGT